LIGLSSVQLLGSFFVPNGARTLATLGTEAVTLPHVFLGMTLLMRHRRLESELVIDGVPTEFMWVIPISAAEWALKKAEGTAALLALFEQHDLPWLFDPNRTSYVP
jgi:hypothetical protein